jgi:hypothetical protein
MPSFLAGGMTISKKQTHFQVKIDKTLKNLLLGPGSIFIFLIDKICRAGIFYIP